MSIRYHHLLSLAVLSLLAGCTVDEQIERSDGHDGLCPITLKATMEGNDDATTRAGTTLLNSNFASGETFYAYFPSGVKVGSATSESSTTFTTTDASGATNPATQPYFNAGATSATVHAYYPYVTGKQVTNSTTSFSVETDQNTDDSYKKSDLMYATASLSKSSASVTGSLSFTHRMAKILVTANIGTGVTNIQSIRIIGGYRTINIATPSTCTLGSTLSDANSTSTYITMYSGTSTSTVNCAALIPPQSISGNFLQIVTDIGTATYSLATEKSFTSAYSYQLTITVNAAAVGTTTSISGWTGTGSVTVQPTNLWSGALPRKFSVSSSKKVYFSQGNLQATTTDNGTTWTWRFATNQWDYIGNAASNTSINGNGTVSANGTVDLFGWVGASSTWTGGAQYGISNSTTTNSTDGYGNVVGEYLKSDWGNLAISNGGNATNSGWFTLTSAEWTYLFGTDSSNKRTTTSGILFAKATVSGKSGVVLLPDDWSSSYYTLSSTNTTGADFTTNSITADDWTSQFEAHGAVFLPAAGYRNGSTVNSAGSNGRYWSSSPNASNVRNAYIVYFNSGSLNPASNDLRCLGYSVRLVRVAE